MSSLSPGLLVLGLILGTVGGVLAARTVGWIFNRFPKTFSPSIQTAHTPVGRRLHSRTTGSPAAT